jgi:RpiR family carbohydrate utilization transcriptional regulator
LRATVFVGLKNVDHVLKYRNDASTTAIETALTARVEAYRRGKRIAFVDVGNSGVVAQDAQHKFCRVGMNTIAYSDSHIPLPADHPEGYDQYSPMVSRLLHLLIIDIVATCVALAIGGETLQPLLRELNNHWRSKRYV